MIAAILSADLDVHLPVILIPFGVVPGEHSENGGGFEVRGVAHDEGIGSVAEAARQGHFSACPLPPAFRYPKMQRPAVVCPAIRRVVEIHSVAAITGRVADPPFVAAEIERGR